MGFLKTLQSGTLPLSEIMAGILFLAAFAPPVIGQAGVGAQLPPGVQVRIEAPRQAATVGDPIRLELDVAVPTGYEAQILPIGPLSGDFSIIEFSQKPPEVDAAVAGAVLRHRASIVVAAYKTGDLKLAPIPIRLRSPDGKQFDISSPPLAMTIQSVLPDEDRALKDLKKQVEIPEPFAWRFWILTLLGFCILGALLWYFMKRRRKRSVAPMPPHPAHNPLDAAEDELRELLSRGLPEEGMVKYFYVRLSDIVKRILEAAYRIHTAERTTSEIMDSMRRGGEGTVESAERIEPFLRRCDLVKFAKYVPRISEHEAAAKDALQILEDGRIEVAGRQSQFVPGSTMAG